MAFFWRQCNSQRQNFLYAITLMLSSFRGFVRGEALADALQIGYRLPRLRVWHVSRRIA